MKKPKCPCRPDCPDRKPGCHNARCKNGWAEYEKDYQKYLLAQQQEKIAIQLAKEDQEDRIRRSLRNKRGGAKILPIR